MRLVADVILRSRASMNPCGERELDVRGYKIAVIENLGVTQDQFDTIDFSDNEISVLDNFPRFQRLTTLHLSNNKVSQIGESLGSELPNLACITLSNNKISRLAEIDNLGQCKKLTMLSLLENPVVRRQHYRLYVIHRIPSLKFLDFQRVKKGERETAEKLFRSAAGKAMETDVASEPKTFVPGDGLPAPALTQEQKRRYTTLLAEAKTAEQVEKLSRLFAAGQLPPEESGGAELPAAAPAAPVAAPTAVAAPAAVVAATEASVSERPRESHPPSQQGAAVGAAAGAGKEAGVGSDDTMMQDEEVAEGPAENGGAGTEGEADNAEGGQSSLEAPNGPDAAAGHEPEPTEAEKATGGGADDSMEVEGDAEEEESVPTLSEAEIKALKVADLKKELSARGQATTGLKAVLAARLLEACGH